MLKLGGDKKSAGVFIKLPKELAKQFPSLGEHDDSVPHITTLFIGKVPKKHEILLEEVVKRVAMEYDPFEIALDEKPSYFPATKHSDGCKVAKMAVISAELKKLHSALKKALLNAEIEVADNFPNYKPHVTLEYMAPPKIKYDGDIPNGTCTVEKIEIWNGDQKTTIPLGRRVKVAAVAEMSKSGVGVGSKVRMYFRQSMPDLAGVPNAELNEHIAGWFASGEPMHRFKLRSGEIAEIRKAQNVFFIAVIRGRGEVGVRYDIIAVQPAYKAVPEDIKKHRMSPGWGVE